jgi:hypothetical protein
VGFDDPLEREALADGVDEPVLLEQFGELDDREAAPGVGRGESWDQVCTMY